VGGGDAVDEGPNQVAARRPAPRRPSGRRRSGCSTRPRPRSEDGVPCDAAVDAVDADVEGGAAPRSRSRPLLTTQALGSGVAGAAQRWGAKPGSQVEAERRGRAGAGRRLGCCSRTRRRGSRPWQGSIADAGVLEALGDGVAVTAHDARASGHVGAGGEAALLAAVAVGVGAGLGPLGRRRRSAHQVRRGRTHPTRHTGPRRSQAAVMSEVAGAVDDVGAAVLRRQGVFALGGGVVVAGAQAIRLTARSRTGRAARGRRCGRQRGGGGGPRRRRRRR
jgi:hypothetical protein